MRATRLPLLLLGLVLSLSSVLACEHAKPTPTVPSSGAFDDFTLPRVSSLAELREIAAAPPGDDMGASIVGAKFVITEFSNANARALRFLDGRHYNYHDEWAWFRLLNAQPVPGMGDFEPHLVHTPAEARKWALENRSDLPDGLTVVDNRVYSAEFYERALAREARDFGTGSVIYIPAHPGHHPETWGFELEYGDMGEVEDVLVFFEMLRQVLPEPVNTQFKWITRSPEQAETAKRLVRAQPEFEQRVMSYDAIAVPGETEVYTSGIVAGRLQAFPELSRLSEASPDNVLLLGALPEYLPQARGVLTSIPQTPLSHLNLLAKSRGIVNVYRGGLFTDPVIMNLARSSAPVVLSTEDGTLRFVRISEAQYAQWLQLQKSPPPPPRAVNLERAPYLVELARVAPEQLDELAPILGGKSVGMVHLLNSIPPAAGGDPARTGAVHFDVPERPLGITVRAYREHIAQFLPGLQALLTDPTFLSSRKIRILALEGLKKFEQRFASKPVREAARTYNSPHAMGAVAAVVRKGGLQRMIRDTPLPRSVEAELARVAKHFASYAPEQGLRFRSSSTVEDVEGSSGAGLYESFTGYVVPRKGGEGLPKRASLAQALRKTWASYFSVEAFEERHEAGMDHLAGSMGVLVHARFDDAHEDSNGVFTFTLEPKRDELLVDAQPGAVSVTNPPTDRVVRPETSRVVSHGGAVEITRAALSSEAPVGTTVLSEAELRELFGLARRLAREQLERSNRPLPPAQHRRSIVMDFEYRRVKAGWPALKSGLNPARFVIKQMRPLEPNPGVPSELRAAPIPRDVLARTRRIETRSCHGEGLDLDVTVVLTDPNAQPDPGFAKQPLLAAIELQRGGRSHLFTHLDHNLGQLTSSGLYVEFKPGQPYANLGVAGHKLQLVGPNGDVDTTDVQCRSHVEFAAPTELLRSFLASDGPQ